MLFAELVAAVFALEKVIAPTRPPSSMVAINRRASFRPHTDAGAGAGQSTSLIVGLGNYRAWLSGAQVGNVFRAPPTQFAERLLYDVHDVTSILQQGGVGSRHGLGVALGHARYASQASASHCTGGQVTCDMAVRVVLSIVFEDGSTQRVVSAPGTWQVTAGPTIHDDSSSGCQSCTAYGDRGLWEFP